MLLDLIETHTMYRSTALAILSLLAFAAAALLSAREAAAQRREDKLGLPIPWWKSPSVLPLCLATSFTLRCVYVILRGLDDPRKVRFDVLEHVLNRFALLFYLTGYAFVVALVMDLVHVQTKGFLRTSGRSKTWIYLRRGVLVVWLTSAGMTVWWSLDRANRVTRFFLPLLFFLLSLLFTRYGWRLHTQRGEGGSSAGTTMGSPSGGGSGRALVRRVHRHTYWLAIAACVSAVLFFVRFLLYLYEPITGKYLKYGSSVLYPYFYYELPELVPGALILLAMRHLRAQSAVSEDGTRCTEDLLAVVDNTAPAMDGTATGKDRGSDAHGGQQGGGGGRSSNFGSLCASSAASSGSFGGSLGGHHSFGFDEQQFLENDDGGIHNRSSSLDNEVMGIVGPGRLPSLSALGRGAGFCGHNPTLSPAILLQSRRNQGAKRSTNAPHLLQQDEQQEERHRQRQHISSVFEDGEGTEPTTVFTRM